MEWLVAVLILIGYAIGLLVGRYISKRTYQTETIGTLLVEVSDPDNPNMLLELDKSPKDIYKYPYVTLKVQCGTYLSQK